MVRTIGHRLTMVIAKGLSIREHTCLPLYYPPWPKSFWTRRREKFTYRPVSFDADKMPHEPLYSTFLVLQSKLYNFIGLLIHFCDKGISVMSRCPECLKGRCRLVLKNGPPPWSSLWPISVAAGGRERGNNGRLRIVYSAFLMNGRIQLASRFSYSECTLRPKLHFKTAYMGTWGVNWNVSLSLFHSLSFPLSLSLPQSLSLSHSLYLNNHQCPQIWPRSHISHFPIHATERGEGGFRNILPVCQTRFRHLNNLLGISKILIIL